MGETRNELEVWQRNISEYVNSKHQEKGDRMNLIERLWGS
jgi:hypothetical protein